MVCCGVSALCMLVGWWFGWAFGERCPQGCEARHGVACHVTHVHTGCFFFVDALSIGGPADRRTIVF